VTQVYGYDGLNRLTTFGEGSLGETNCYDEHGNRAVQQRVGLSPLVPQVTQCTAGAVRALFPGNRWAMTSYDAGGGIGNDGRSEVRYDAEDRVVKTWPAGGGPETAYGYDGDGKRVTAGGVVFVYDGFGKVAVEYGSAVSATGLDYVGVDHLGSTRALVGSDGVVGRRMDYWPFGMELSGADTAWRTAGLGFVVDGRARAKFTGQMRDEGTGLDYFGARYYSGAMGRFGSTDPLRESANPRVPQTWNRYGYGLDNPLVYVDVNGEWPFYVHNRIYAYAFEGFLTPGQIRVVQETSWNADFGPGAQNPANSPQHSMCAPGQTIGVCSLAIHDYVTAQLDRASSLSDRGRAITRDSLVAFGRGVHTLTDMGSPAHMGPNGPLPWGNGRVEGMVHFLGERSEPVNWLMLGQSVRLAIAGFVQSFPKLAAGRDLNAWAARTITRYVTDYYAAPGSGRAPNPVLEDAARQCALGNPAACFH
jgi:RHS repeat-associated protein